VVAHGPEKGSVVEDQSAWGGDVMPPFPPKTKPWYLSKTVLVNLLTAAVAVTTALAGQQIVADNPSLAASLTAAIAGLNVVLRFITVLPLGAAK